MEIKGLSKAENKMLKELVKAVNVTRPTPRTTVCVIILEDETEIFGISQCKDLDKYDNELGYIYSLRHALGKLYRSHNRL